ncbi:MAG: ABC transporter permease [Candidatus Micrarchaeota archaeon]|nr:ABC transporter permease [Candidatus Micrarchaeota archaeon]
MASNKTKKREVAPAPQSGEYPIPSDMMHIWIMAKYSIINYFRSRRFYIMLAIALILGLLFSLLLWKYGTGTIGASSIGLYVGWWGSTIGTIVVLCAILFGGDAISREFQNKTGYSIIGNPIRRAPIYLGKLLGAFMVSLIVIVIYMMMVVANSIYYFGPSIPSQFWESLAFTIIYTAAALSLTFVISSLSKSGAVSIAVSAVLLLFGFGMIGLLVQVFGNVQPFFLLSYSEAILSSVFSPVQPHDPTVLQGLIIMVVYFSLCTMLGLFVFEKKGLD